MKRLWWIAPVVLLATPWLADGYTTTLLTKAFSFGLLAVSVAMLTGVGGLPTLGQTAPYLAGAYATALLVRAGADVGVEQLLVAAVAGTLVAVATAPLVVPARGVAAMMITLALGELAAITAAWWKPVTGGSEGLVALTPPRLFWGLPTLDGDRAGYVYALAVAGVVTGAVVAVLRTPLGLLLRGGAQDEARMRASGHPVTGYLAVTYLAAGAVAGVGGALLVTANRYVSPSDGGFATAALALLAVVIGGLGSVPGSLAGAALVLAVRDWLAAPVPGQAPLVLGLVFVVAAYALPRGLAGLVRRA